MSFTNAQIIADCLNILNEQMGAINPALSQLQQVAFSNARLKLATCIAESGIFTRDNSTVTVEGVTVGDAAATGALT